MISYPQIQISPSQEMVLPFTTYPGQTPRILPWFFCFLSPHPILQQVLLALLTKPVLNLNLQYHLAHQNGCNNLTGFPVSTQAILKTVTRIYFLKHKLDHINPLLKTLQGVPITLDFSELPTSVYKALNDWTVPESPVQLLLSLSGTLSLRSADGSLLT